MTTIDERLRQAININCGFDDAETLQRELAARGLAVVEMPPKGLETREQLVAAWTGQGLTLARYHGIIRDLLHLLDTAEGYWVTDMPEHYGQMTHKTDYIVAQHGTYFRQTFKDTDAVKRAREMMDL